MTKKGKPKRPRALSPIGDYEVGYGKPPKAHRFKAGQPSANPKGRPPKPKAESALDAAWTNGFHKMTAEEAMRPVQVRDGNRVITIPAYKAATRAALIKAASGNQAAYRNIVQAIERSQRILRAEKTAMFEAAVDYYQAHLDYARRCDKQGIDHGLMIHPDDMRFDLVEGLVHIAGPLTSEQREAHQMVRDGVSVANEKLIEACTELREHPRRTTLLPRIKLLVDLIKRANEALPTRYQVSPEEVLFKEGIEMAKK